MHFRQFLLKSNLFWGTREENRLHSCTGFKGYIVDKASDLWAHSPYALNTLSSTVGIFWKRPIKNILTSVCRLWRVSYSFFWSTYLSSERSTRMDQNGISSIHLGLTINHYVTSNIQKMAVQPYAVDSKTSYPYYYIPFIWKRKCTRKLCSLL